MHLHHSCSLKSLSLSSRTSRGSCILVAIVDGVGSTLQKLPTDFTVILCDQQAARGEQRQREQARKTSSHNMVFTPSQASYSPVPHLVIHKHFFISLVVQQNMSNMGSIL